MTNMLVITTTMGMLYRVHGYTSSLRPAVALGLVFVVSTASLQQGLLDTSSTSNNTDHGAGVGGHHLLGSGGKLEAGLVGIGVVTDDGDVVPGSPGDLTSVADLGLDIGHDGTFGHFSKGEDVADAQLSLPAAVHVHTGVHTFGGDHKLLAEFISIRVAENYLGERCTSSGVVDDLLHDTSDIAVLLGVVQRSESGGPLAVGGVGSEYGSTSLSLCSDYTSHSSLFPVQDARQ